MKKLLSTVILIVMSLCAAFAFVGCDSGESGGGNGGGSDRLLAEGNSAITIKGFDWSFMRSENYVSGMTSADGVKYESLEADTDYYLVCDFDVSSVRDNDGQTRFLTNIIFDDISILDGTIQEVGSGSTNEQEKLNPDSGKMNMEATVSFKIPAFSDDVKHITITMRLVPVKIGYAHISISFGDRENHKTEEGTSINGDDGVTKAIDIVRAAVAAPVISFDSRTNMLIWKHVKNADYYKIFVDDSSEALKDGDGNEIIIAADEATQEGQEMSVILSRYIYGLHRVKIQAFNESANFTNSHYSNTVEVEI